MPKPTETFPDWCSDEGNFVEPAPSRLAAGWDTNQIPPSAEQNWWQRITSKWVHYLDTLEAEDLDWTGNHTFTADDFTVTLTGDSVGFTVTVGKGAAWETNAWFMRWGYAPADDGTDVPIMLWGSGDQDRVRTQFVDKALFFLFNAYYDDTDQTFKRVAAGDSYAYCFGQWITGGVGAGMFRALRRGADEADGWVFSGWSTSGKGTGTSAGNGTILSGNEALNIGTAGGGAYANSWADLGGGIAAEVYKDPFGRCWFKGAVKLGNSLSNLSTQPLPVYLRPALARSLGGFDITDNKSVEVIVLASGHIQIATAGNGHTVYLDGLSYL